MKRFLSIFTIILLTSQIFMCQAQRSQRGMSSQDRQKWLDEMRSYKHDFLTQELGLTPQQQSSFFPIYDEMEDELNKISTETRDLEKKVTTNPKATDAEMESAARTLFEQKQREGTIEMAYFARFKKILTPRQLLLLKDAERKFTRKLVKQTGRSN